MGRWPLVLAILNGALLCGCEPDCERLLNCGPAVPRPGSGGAGGSGDGGNGGDGGLGGQGGGISNKVGSLTCGFVHTCAIRSDGGVWCWGDNMVGAAGPAFPEQQLNPTPAAVGLNNTSEVRAGSRARHSCAVVNERPYCWGEADHGQLAITAAYSATPVEVPLSDVSHVCTGFWHSCASTSSGQAWCWGNNMFGQLGDGTTAVQYDPKQVVFAGDIADIQCDGAYTCALTSGDVWCWGANNAGQLGIGNTENQLLPIKTLNNVASMAVGTTHTCVLMQDQSLRCWGANYVGQLGTGDTQDKLVPVPSIALTNLSMVTTGLNHTCAIAGGNVHCWGSNEFGQLGDGTTIDSLTSVAVSLPAAAVTVSAGGSHTCAWLADESIYCWGGNAAGQLGDGTSTDRHLPVKVIF